MFQFCLCILTLFLAVGNNAFPQDAEYIPSSISRNSYDYEEYDTTYDRPFFSPYDWARRMFEQFTFPPFRRIAPPLPPPFIPMHPMIPRQPLIPIPPVPDFSKLPDNYTNSTQEVKYVNGKKVVVNQKTFKSKGGAGFIYSHSHSYHLAPDDNSQGSESPDHKDNQSPDVAATDHGFNQSPDVAATDHGFNKSIDVAATDPGFNKSPDVATTDRGIIETTEDESSGFGLPHMPRDDSLNLIPKVDVRRPDANIPSDGTKSTTVNDESPAHRSEQSPATRRNNGNANDSSNIYP